LTTIANPPADLGVPLWRHEALGISQDRVRIGDAFVVLDGDVLLYRELLAERRTRHRGQDAVVH
jgi:hypothetical protein